MQFLAHNTALLFQKAIIIGWMNDLILSLIALSPPPPPPLQQCCELFWTFSRQLRSTVSMSLCFKSVIYLHILFLPISLFSHPNFLCRCQLAAHSVTQNKYVNKKSFIHSNSASVLSGCIARFARTGLLLLAACKNSPLLLVPQARLPNESASWVWTTVVGRNP